MWVNLENLHTWLFPFNIKRLVTLPNGRPNDMTSASVTSLGILRRWRTREGEQGGLSPLNFLLSFPLAKKYKICFLITETNLGWHTTLTILSHLIFQEFQVLKFRNYGADGRSRRQLKTKSSTFQWVGFLKFFTAGVFFF